MRIGSSRPAEPASRFSTAADASRFLRCRPPWLSIPPKAVSDPIVREQSGLRCDNILVRTGFDLSMLGQDDDFLVDAAAFPTSPSRNRQGSIVVQHGAACSWDNGLMTVVT